jgi:hypothetical protein
VIITAASIVPLAWIAMSAGYPQWWSPLPLFLILPMFALESVAGGFVVGAAVLVGSFLLASFHLLKGRPRISWWTVGALAFVQGLNGVSLVGGFSYGVEYQGRAHTIAVCMINVGLLIAVALVGILCWRRPKFLMALAFHWLAWFWLTVYSFPYLGELP